MNKEPIIEIDKLILRPITIEKCGLKFDHYGEYMKLDGSKTFKAKYYKMELE